MGYDPYPYQSQLQHFYNGKPLPQVIDKAMRENPEAAQHIVAVHAFNEWLQDRFPAVHGAVLQHNPSMTDAVRVVKSGALSPTNTPPKGLSGLGEAEPATSWGKSITDAAAGLLQLKSQNDLIKLNTERAEKGLPPIDPGSITPGVNVGLSPDTQKLAVLGIGAALIVGLAAVLTRK